MCNIPTILLSFFLSRIPLSHPPTCRNTHFVSWQHASVGRNVEGLSCHRRLQRPAHTLILLSSWTHRLAVGHSGAHFYATSTMLVKATLLASGHLYVCWHWKVWGEYSYRVLTLFALQSKVQLVILWLGVCQLHFCPFFKGLWDRNLLKCSYNVKDHILWKDIDSRWYWMHIPKCIQ